LQLNLNELLHDSKTFLGVNENSGPDKADPRKTVSEAKKITPMWRRRVESNHIRYLYRTNYFLGSS